MTVELLRGVDELIWALESFDAEAFRLRLLGADSPLNRTMVSDGAFERALAGEAQARAEVRSALGVDLGILRSAGLLTIRDEGERGWRYALRVDGLRGLGPELESYLRPDRRPDEARCRSSSAGRRRSGANRTDTR